MSSVQGKKTTSSMRTELRDGSEEEREAVVLEMSSRLAEWWR